MKKAVCLISGGLDSCVTTFIAKNEGYEIHALSFDYGQRHKKEITCAKNISKSAKVKNHLFFKIDLSKFGGSSLTDKKTVPEKNHSLENIGKKIPSTYVPARNIIFLSIALAYAETIGAEAIFIGATAMDYAGYPDCRPEFIKAFQRIADIGTKKGVEGKPILIKAPLLHLSKAVIIKKGLELKVPFEKTWSCYYGRKKACGRCDSCLLRLKGFKESGNEDPIEYEQLPKWYLK